MPWEGRAVVGQLPVGQIQDAGGPAAAAVVERASPKVTTNWVGLLRTADLGTGTVGSLG